MYNFLIYLAEVTVCQAIFCLLYLGVFRNLSFFQINRVFLLSATLLSFVIPAISIPFWDAPSTNPELNLAQNLQNFGSAITSSGITAVEENFFNMKWIIFILFLVYFTGFCLRLIKVCIGVMAVLNLIKSNAIREYNGIKAIHLNNGPSFFAFLNYVFINTNKLNLSTEEFHQVISHEKSHILQKHTIDNLFMELALIICWFNPLLKIMKKELNNVHEFYADQKASGLKGDIDSYSTLILRLSSDKDGNTPFLSHQFSMNNIKKRIIMLNKKKNPKKIVLRYIMIVPCLTVLLVMFSFTQKAPLKANIVYQNHMSQIIGNISWEGNTLYSDSYLSEFLGLKKGDIFNENDINDMFNYNPDGSDVGSLYMDKGYLFFFVEMKKTIHEGSVDLVFEFYEGEVMSVGKVFITGNKKIQTKEILKMINIKEGDLFNRSKLISSQHKITQSGLFDPEKVIPTPHPRLEEGKVDIEFKVAEL